MVAGILDFNFKLPEVIYLDTSFILNFSIEGAKYFDDCSFFIRRLMEENILCNFEFYLG